MLAFNVQPNGTQTRVNHCTPGLGVDCDIFRRRRFIHALLNAALSDSFFETTNERKAYQNAKGRGRKGEKATLSIVIIGKKINCCCEKMGTAL